MEKTSRNILVPYDYTEESNYAVNYAIQLSKTIGTDIVLLNIVKDIEQEAMELPKLEEVAKSFHEKHGVIISCKIRHGIVHKVIKTIAISTDALLVIMKTQHQLNKKKSLRSKSIRVMMGCQIPFIIVQKPPKRLSIKNIVFPIDFRRENKEKLIWVSILSKFYTSVVHLFKPNGSEYRVKTNLTFAKRLLESKNLEYKIVNGKKRWHDANEVIDYANTIDAQLIIIMLNRNIGWASYLFGLNAQKYITNKYKIPVMVLNSKAELHNYESFN